MKTIKYIALFITIAIISQSCRKDNDEVTIIPPQIEPKMIVTASVLGTVEDEEGNAVVNALVSFEDKTTFTNEFGVFQFNDESMYSNGTFIKVTKDGYFDGSRTFYASEANTSIVKIEMIPLNEVGEFSNSIGGSVSFEKVEMKFEANSIVNEDGSEYNGNVNIAAKYLDPTILNTLNQMPGDLTGRTTTQNRVVLTSMAMISVELMDDAGNELQVKEGKSVDVLIPVPSSLLDVAPTTIVMWHFDEDAGIWVEEGSATLVNGVYETSLGHFSFWNCDIPNEFVFLKGSILNREIPIQGINVVISLSNGGATSSTITDIDGFFCGFVPKNEDLILNVLNPCGVVVYSMNIPASEIDIFLDQINLYLETNVITISGSVEYCHGTPSIQTYVFARQGTLNNVIGINEDFTFSSNIFYCDNNVELFVHAVDPINVVASETSTFNITGNIDGVNLEMCEDNGQLVDPRDGQKYLTTVINGVTWTAENMRFDTDNTIPDGLDVDFSTVPTHYGRYYNFNSAQSACPDGWHLPSEAEFFNLISSFNTGASTIALKSTQDWINNENGTNSSGFNAFPTGQVFTVQMTLSYVGSNAYLWSSTKVGETAQVLSLNSGSNAEVKSKVASLGYPVRCIKD